MHGLLKVFVLVKLHYKSNNYCSTEHVQVYFCESIRCKKIHIWQNLAINTHPTVQAIHIPSLSFCGKGH